MITRLLLWRWLCVVLAPVLVVAAVLICMPGAGQRTEGWLVDLVGFGPRVAASVPAPTPTLAAGQVPVLYVYKSDMPAIYENDLAAIRDGYPSELRYDPDRTAQNRRRYQACSPKRKAAAGIEPPMECDEYPFAATLEGGLHEGKLPRIAPVTRPENGRQGAEFGAFITSNHLTAGSPFVVRPVPQ